MALKKVNFQLTTPYLDLDTRDFAPTVAADLDASKATSLVDGEWMQLDAGYKIKRAANEHVLGLVFPMYAEKGRTELQALGKCPVIWRGSFEFRTTHIASTVGLALGEPVVIDNSDIHSEGGSVVRAGLKGGTNALAGKFCVGFVTRAVDDAFDCRIFSSIGGFGLTVTGQTAD